MSWLDASLELLGPVYKPRLDPRRAERVYREFDETRGFSSYLELCRRAFCRPGAVPPAASLQTRGFAHLDVLEPDSARDFLQAVRSRCPVGMVKQGRRRLDGFLIDDPGLRDSILSAVLAGGVDRQLIGFFGSEYLVQWMHATATPPEPEAASVSFRWHCDRGPRMHLKLIVYLNATAEHGGNTEFITASDTAAVAARGYVFGRVRARTGHVDDLSAVAGRPISTHLQDLPAGGGVLFQPAVVLHRGITPDRGTRYALTLCLLPSPLPWHEALALGTLLDLSVDDKWPHHARELAQVLVAPADG